jgi:hypothetical protein
MKNLTYILVAIVMVACNTPTVDTSKPEGIPDYIRWGTYESEAWKQGRVHFNEDSSIMLIVPIRAEHNETSTSLTDLNNIIITE